MTALGDDAVCGRGARREGPPSGPAAPTSGSGGTCGLRPEPGLDWCWTGTSATQEKPGASSGQPAVPDEPPALARPSPDPAKTRWGGHASVIGQW